MPKPPGLSAEGYLEYCRQREILRDIGDTCESNAKYVVKIEKDCMQEEPEMHSNTSSKEEKVDGPGAGTSTEKHQSMDDDMEYENSDDDDEPEPEKEEDDDTDTEDEAHDSNDVDAPIMEERKEYDNEDGIESAIKAKRKLLL